MIMNVGTQREWQSWLTLLMQSSLMEVFLNLLMSNNANDCMYSTLNLYPLGLQFGIIIFFNTIIRF
jgi:hypothetical protein